MCMYIQVHARPGRTETIYIRTLVMWSFRHPNRRAGAMPAEGFQAREAVWLWMVSWDGESIYLSIHRASIHTDVHT